MVEVPLAEVAAGPVLLRAVVEAPGPGAGPVATPVAEVGPSAPRSQVRTGDLAREVPTSPVGAAPAGAFEMRLELGEPSAAGLRDVAVQVRHLGEVPAEANVLVSVTLPGAGSPWWLVPGAFYGENRPEACVRTFPRFAVGAHDPAGMVSEAWEFRADRAATPAVFGWGRDAGVGMVAQEGSPVGMTGVGLAHEAGSAVVHLRFPFRELPISYDGSQQARPPEVSTYEWAPGEEAVLRCSVVLLPADRHAYAPVLREVRERAITDAPVEPWVDVHGAAALAAEGLVRWHYDPDPGVLLETVGFDRGIGGTDRQAMHVGWVSGIPWAYALGLHAERVGDGAAMAAARSVIDFCCAELSPSGTFWGTWYRDRGWTQSWSPVRGALHSRTLAEATLFLVRSLRSAVGRGRGAWAAAARSNLDVVAGRQRADGNLGTLHHARTGEVLSWSGAAGLLWVAALAEAEELDGDGRFLRAAERAGEHYAGYVLDEFLYGAPEDVDLAPSSEDGYNAVLAYTALHRRTGSERWLDLARRAADWMLTFRYTYNTAFDPRTTLGIHGFATRGADQASPSNPHLHAYGLVCTAELHELSAALGDRHYADRADEHLACFRQLLARVDGEVNSYRGMVTERYYQTAAFQPKGMVLTLSHAWSAGVLLLGCEQAIALGRASSAAAVTPG